MKKLFVLFLATVFFAPLMRGATPAFQDFDGSQFGTNANKVRIKDGASTTNVLLKTINPSDNTGVIGERLTSSLLWTTSTNGVSTSRLLFAITPDATVIYTNGVFLRPIFSSGIGSWTNGAAATGVTNNPNGTIQLSGTISANGVNVASLSANTVAGTDAGKNLVSYGAGNGIVISGGNIIATGNGSGLTNVSAQTLTWPTNAASTATINVSMPFAAVSTNNSINITGYSGFDGTNAFPFTRIYTNTAGSAAVKSLTLPVGTIVVSAPFTNVVYMTNQTIVSGVIYPGFGTNCSITGN